MVICSQNNSQQDKSCPQPLVTLDNGIQYAHDGKCAVILVVRGCVLM